MHSWKDDRLVWFNNFVCIDMNSSDFYLVVKLIKFNSQ